MLTAEERRALLKGGGTWLRAARNWLQWHKSNGSKVTWGSNDEVRMTVKEIEELALEVAVSAHDDYMRARYTFPGQKS